MSQMLFLPFLPSLMELLKHYQIMFQLFPHFRILSTLMEHYFLKILITLGGMSTIHLTLRIILIKLFQMLYRQVLLLIFNRQSQIGILH
jgi:hypothetical protein